MALFDIGAKELALSAYDSGDTTETAVEAYRKARAGGSRPGAGAAVRHLGHRAGAAGGPGRGQCRVLFQRRVGRPARRLDHGHRRPAAGPPRRRPRDRRRHQTLRHLRAADALWRADGAHAGKPCRRARRHGGGGRALRSPTAPTSCRRPGGSPPRPRARASRQARHPGAGGAAPALDRAGLADRRRHRQGPGAVHRHRRLGRARHRRTTPCCAAPGMPRPIRPGAPTSSAASPRPTAARRIAWPRWPTTAWRWPATSRA